MGYHLSKKYSDKVYSIGFTSSKGSYGILGDSVRKVPQPAENSLEAFADSQKFGNVFFDLSDVHQKFTSSILEYKPVFGNWNSAFDAIVYLDSVVPSQIISKGLKEKEVLSQSAVISNKKVAQKYRVNGKVVDENHKIIPYCTIYVSPQNISTASNSSGFFSFELPYTTPNDSIRISALGFRSISRPLQILPDTIAYHLNEKVNQLAEVIVKAIKLDANLIMRKVIDNISKNYYSDSASLSIHLNLLHFENDTTKLDVKILADVYLSNVASIREKVGDISILTKPRNIKWDKYPKQSSLDTNTKWNFIGLHYSALNGDLSAHLFDVAKIKKFNFKLVGITKNHNQNIFIVAFESIKKSRSFTNQYYMKRYYGKLYINEEDFAILKCERYWERDTSILNGFTRQHFKKGKRNGFNDWRYSVYKYLYEKSEISKTIAFEKSQLGYYMPVYSKGVSKESGFDLFKQKKFSQFSSTEIVAWDFRFDSLKKIEPKDSYYALKDIIINDKSWVEINPSLYDK